MKKRLTILQITACLLFTGFSLHAGILEQLFWDGVTDADGNRTTAVEDLRAFPGFPDAPVDSLDLDPAEGFSTPRGQGDDFGSLIRGYIVSPVSGDVTFYNASDDNSEFLLSTDDTAGNLQLLGKETGCCTPIFSGARVEERSGTVTLEAGGIYYFEALYQEGGGGDWMDVGWELPDGTQEIIPAGALLPFPSAVRPAGPPQADFSHFPFDQFVPESSLVTFRVDLFGSVAGMKFQWKKNGADIAGAIVPWIIVSADLADDGAVFSLNVTSDAGSADIYGGSMFVEPDFVQPTLVNVRASGNPQGIIATFSEFVDEASATNTSNYSFSGQSFTISGATLLSDGVSVLLSVGTYNTDEAQLSVSNVKDTSNAANVIAANSSADVVFKSLLLAYWDFNTPGATTTDIIGGHTGTIEGGAVFTDAAGSRTGNAGDLSLDFGPEDTDQLVRVENADWLNVLGEADQMTVTVWQKLHAVANTSTFWMSSESSGSGDRGAQVHIPWSNNNIYFDTAGCCNGGTQRLNGALPAESFLEWHHYTFVKDGIDKRIYVDGELFLETVNTNPLPTDFSNLMIGADGDGGNNLLGIVDDFAIFEAALAVDDIVGIAGGASPKELAGPISQEISLTTDISDQTVDELTSVTFTVEATGTTASGIAYQWFRDGNPVSRANGPSLTLSSVTLADSGSVFKAEVFNFDGAFNRLESAEATLTVEGDVDGPTIVDIEGSGFFNTATIEFNESVTADSAANTSNYAMTNLDTGASLDVTGATVRDDRTVVLDTAMQTSGERYQVVVNGVEDVSDQHNPSDNATAEFTAWEESIGGLSRIAWVSTVNNLDDFPLEFRGKGRFDLVNLPILNDDLGTTVPYFETPNSGNINIPPGGNIADNYKAVLYGWLNPTVTGNYRFSLAADDNAEMYLSTDENPGNSQLIAFEPSWNPVRAFGTTARRDEVFPQNLSDTMFPGGIPLVAGEKYYIEAIFSEGGGGDNLAVSWKLPGDDSAFADGDLPIAGEFLSAVLPVDDGFVEPEPEPGPDPLDGTLVVYWDFDDFSDPTMTIDSVNGIVGGIEGGAVFTDDQGGRSGESGDYAMDFGIDSDSQLIRVPDAAFLNVLGEQNAATISFWQKLHEVASTSTFWFNTANSEGVTNGERGIQAHVTWGNNQIYFDSAGCCSAGATRINANIDTFPAYFEGFLSEWHHFAFVKNGDFKEIWIDGELFLDGTGAALPTDFTEMIIGAAGNGGGSLHGIVDEFAVFAVGLTPEEIGRLAAGELPTDIAPTYVLPSQPGQGITEHWDFDDGLPEGSEVAGDSEYSATEGVDGGGALIITRALGGQQGGWLSGPLGTVGGIIIDFDILIDGGTATQADGISLALSDDLVPVVAFGENGRGSKLRINFDNWDNGGGEAPAIDIVWADTIIATVPMGTQEASTLDTDGWWPVHIEVTTNGDTTITYNGELIHDQVNIPDWAPIEDARIAFGGRTGGANANQWIDNLWITIIAAEMDPSSDLVLLDFGGEGASGAGPSPEPWITLDSLTQDEVVDLGGGVTLTALDDGFSVNNPAQPGEGAVYDGVDVPQEARNDYLFKNVDTGGTEARMRIDGLAAGTYNVTVFEGRTSDASQFAKIWVGDEPASENTGSFAGVSATVEVVLNDGDTLWYKHLEDGSGGISGMIIRPTSGGVEPVDPPVLGEGLVATDGGLTRVAWNGPGVTLDFYPEEGRGKFRFDTIELEARQDSQGNFVTYFETPNSGDINVAPEGDFFGDYAVILYGFIHPAETGTYRFALAADDYAALYLSTDEDPANTVLIASEPLWNPVRSFGSTDRRGNGENLSAGIELEAGQKYYVEAIMKEAGGGDNIAVAWKGPGDDSAFADGDLPISGEFLSGFAPPVPGTLYVEAEDFDFDGGSWVSDANIGLSGPYAGNAYDGLGATQGIDFDGAGSTRAYRTTGDPGPSVDKESGPEDVRNARDGFIVESNWIMGWNDAGDWTNYTRDFPHGSYWVSGDFSSGGEDISVQLDVVTDGAGTDAQTLSKLGEFNGAATGSWDVFAPIQLANDDGSPAVISLGGVQTLRLTTLPGNMDVNFLKFTPKQALYIEAEDFDFDGGSWIASGTGFDGPYPGNAYNGLGGTQGIDFDGAGSTRAYRTTGDPGPSVDKESAADDVRNARDGFELESNWILGWNDPGDWTNYTRDFPEDNYEVVGMFSSGGEDISAQLDIVVDGAGTDSQTLEKLGEFNGAATGNWDVFAPIQLRDDSGNPAVVSLAGVQTLRITTLPGNLDWNFIKFFPSVRGGGGSGPGESISISFDADGDVVVTWTGLLQSAPDVTGPWSDVADDSQSPLTLTPDQARLFARAVAP